MALALTDKAKVQVKKILEDQKLENVFLRMGVKGGGCSGLSYSLEFDSELGKHDKKFELDGVTLDVAREAFALAAAKLPIGARFVVRQGEETG